MKPLPTEGTLKSVSTVVDVVDKGKGALIVQNGALWDNYFIKTCLLSIYFLSSFFINISVDTFDENGEKILFNQIVAFVVGAGGFGGPKQSSKIVPIASAPSRKPDVQFIDKTIADQVLFRIQNFDTFFEKKVSLQYVEMIFVSGCYLQIIG